MTRMFKNHLFMHSVIHPQSIHQILDMRQVLLWDRGLEECVRAALTKPHRVLWTTAMKSNGEVLVRLAPAEG